ncbi:MAG: hypothetical protein ACTSV9_06185 [Candidatus Thorarchaeota archaeon]
MKAEKIKAEFANLQTHMGSLRDSKFKMKCNVTYEDLLLVMDGGKRVVRLHARNMNNVHLEKKAIRIAALNFEVNDDGDVSVVSGSIRLEVGNDSEAWYKELWG